MNLFSDFLNKGANLYLPRLRLLASSPLLSIRTISQCLLEDINRE